MSSRKGAFALNLLRRLRESESGAALVEMAIVSIILFTMIFGIVEYGLAFSKRLTVANATETAARVGSGVVGSTVNADIAILEALEGAINSGVAEDIIHEVWIYEADADGEWTGNTDTRNRYLFDLTNPDCHWSPCPDPAEMGAAGPWDPGLRSTSLSSGLTIIGVRVFFEHEWITSFLGYDDLDCNDGATDPPADCWADTAVMRMEPQSE